MNYKVIFDIANSASPDYPVQAIPLVIVGLFLVVFRKRLPGWWGNHPRASSIFSFFFFGFSLLITTLMFFITHRNYSELLKAESSGKLSISEGKVKNFVPMPEAGHAMESFCVDKSCFEYSDYVITGGFNNSASHGGPIKDGLQVRVSYLGNKIVKLEVEK